MSFSNEAVLNALSNVQDPDLKKDLVTLNMVRNLVVEGNQINFDLVLTTPACPLKDKIKNDCLAALNSAFGQEIDVHIRFDAEITSQRKESEPVLPGVKNIIGFRENSVILNQMMVLIYGH